MSLDVDQGQIVTVLGANGAGKTTVLRTISGVLDPERGQVVFEGQDIARTPPDQVMRRGICHVPEGREIFPFLTVRENLNMGAYTRRDPAGVARDTELCFDYFPRLKEREAQLAKSSRVSLEGLAEQIKQAGVKDLNLILKGDVQGSVEVLADSLARMSTEKVRVRVLHSGVGAITESDVLLAAASNAVRNARHRSLRIRTTWKSACTPSFTSCRTR